MPSYNKTVFSSARKAMGSQNKLYKEQINELKRKDELDNLNNKEIYIEEDYIEIEGENNEL